MESTFDQAKKIFAANVRAARLTAGISQEELAFKAGIDRTYASQIERAIANPSLGITCAVADALGCNVIELLTPRKLAD